MFLVLFKHGGSRVSSRFHLCDAIMENNFPWQHRWIPLCRENFGMWDLRTLKRSELSPALFENFINRYIYLQHGTVV